MLSPRLPHILIVEDNQTLAEMLNQYFEAQGYRPLIAEQGSKALAIAAEQLLDLIILDIHLPDIDGWEVCRRLRTSHLTRDIPIIFLTEVDRQYDKLHGLELGVVDYITKPFDLQELKLRIRNILRRAETRGAENSVTGLPASGAVSDALIDAAQASYGVVVVTLCGLSSFRNLYGIIASDEVLRVMGQMVRAAAEEFGGPGVFCGHLDHETFTVLIPALRLPALQGRLYERSLESLEYFYSSDNRGPTAHTGDRLRLEVSCLARIPVGLNDLPSLKKAALHATTLR